MEIMYDCMSHFTYWRTIRFISIYPTGNASMSCGWNNNVAFGMFSIINDAKCDFLITTIDALGAYHILLKIFFTFYFKS